MTDFFRRWWRRSGAPAPAVDAVLRRVQVLLARHREQELQQPWPDMPEALAELAVIEGMAVHLAANNADGAALLQALEATLAARLENYASRAEYSSDKGRLGSVLVDVSALRAELAPR